MVFRRKEGTFPLPFLTQNLAATVIHPYSQTLAKMDGHKYRTGLTEVPLRDAQLP